MANLRRAPHSLLLGGSALLLLSTEFNAMPAFAQSTFATIQGTVLDTSGAVVPQATIRIQDDGTGLQRTVFSDGSGVFRVFDLNAGTYTFTVGKPGFGEQTFPHQALLARQVVRLDVTLTPGAVATEVEVNGGANDFSDAATVTHSLSSGDIDTLALNFRASDSTSPLYVATLTPGVQTDPSGNISVAGGFPYTTSYSIDGISTVNARFNGPSANLFPSVEAISEFKVNSANNDAEFGQPSDITVTTKAGTNQFHGGVYEFNQNSALNAANPVTHQQGPLNANDFGAYVGGPLSIPHFYNSKGKTFFFGDYEGTRRPESGSIAISVPPDAFRAGNFAALCTAGFSSAGVCTNAKQQLYHPFSAVPYLNNQVPVSASATALVSALYPHATNAGLANNYNAAYPGNYTLNNGDVRIDENFNDRHHLWARFGGKNVNLTGTDGSTTYDPANGTYVQPQRLRNLVVSYSWTITPKVVNELRGGYSVADFLTSYPLAAQGSAILAAAGITGLPAAPPSGGVPALNFTDGSYNTDNQDGRPHTTKNLTYNISDQVTYQVGRHALKAGVDYQHYQFRDYLDFTAGDQYGDYYFSGQVTGYAFADFIAGYPVATDYSVDGPDVLPFAHALGFYAQDSWKALPNLTVDYGLRYEIHAPFNDATNQLANFIPTVPGGEVVVQGQAGLNQVLPVFRSSIGSTQIVTNTAANLPYTLRQTYYGDVDPRLGLTFEPFPTHTHKTVVHAGVGAYTVPVLGSVLYSLAGVATSNYLIFQDSATQVLQFPNVFPSGGGAGQAGLPDYRRANQINLKDPRQIQWNGSIEQGIGYQTVLRLSYTGSHTTQLIQSPDLNQVPANTLGYAAYKAQYGVPFPNFNAVLTRSNGPSAKYEAFTTEVERRYAKGLSLDGNYTFAHDVSNALGAVPTTLTAENGATILDRFNEGANYGNVIYVRRNRFVGTFQYDLPYGRGQRFGGKINPAANLLLGGWGVAGIQLWQSGPFLTPSFSGTDPSGTGVLVRGVTTAQRPDCTGISPVLANHSRTSWFNSAAFSTPANNIGRFGNCPVGTLVGPGTVSFAGTLSKNFAITERIRLRYEAQIANLFNHVNLGIPNTNISSSAFGTISNVQDATTSYGPSAGPRNVQMSLRLTF